MKSFRGTLIYGRPLCGRGSKGSEGSEGSEGCGIVRRAMSMKSALRDDLALPYDMKNILLTDSLRSPPYPAAPDFPLFRGAE